MRAADFLGGIGVNTHVAYTDGGYANVANIAADLAYLGVTKVRDGISDGEYGSAPLSSYIALARAGITFTFYVGGGTSTTASVQYTLGKITTLAETVPGSVNAVEGPNEINNQTLTFNGQGGLDGAVALQRYLYQSVKSNANLAGVKVDYFTGYSNYGFAAGPDPSTTAGLADLDTQHPYPRFGQAPAAWVDPAATLLNEPGAKGAFVYTETGYTTKLDDPGGVDATVQGKYTLDLLMDTAKAGASGTYLYELMDAYAPGSPQGDAGYGLFDTDNSPKLAAVDIHNLTAILADTGASATTFTPAALPYTLSGLPSTGNSLEIAKSDGTTDIVVWAEPTLWTEPTTSSPGAEVAAPTETVTVGLGGLHAVSVYDPLVGTAPIATYAATSTVAVSVTDHPLIIAVGPTLGTGASGAAATAPTQAAATDAAQAALTAATQAAATAATQAAAIQAAAAAATQAAATQAAATAATQAAATQAAAAAAATAATQAATAAAATQVTATTAATTAAQADTTQADAAAVPLGASSQGGASLLAASGSTAADTGASSAAADTDPGFTAVTRRNGSRTVDVTAPGHTISSYYRDTFQVNGMAATTFVFDPGYGLDVLNDFRLNGAGHDTISLVGSDFAESIANVLRHTQNVAGGVRIVDPTSGDSIRITGVTKAQLQNNRQDFAFHDGSA